MTADADPPVGPEASALWGAYVHARDLGLREQSLSSLDAFIDALEAGPDDERLGFCRWVCRLAFEGEAPDGRPVDFQFPLLRRLIAPFLLEGAEAGRTPELRWIFQLGRLHDEALLPVDPDGSAPWRGSVLRQAVEIDPEDARAWHLMLAQSLEIADYAAHHLHEGRGLVLEDDVCRSALATAAEIVERAPAWVFGDREREQLDMLQRMCEGWFTYRDSGSDQEYVVWCAEHDVPLPFVATYEWHNPQP